MQSGGNRQSKISIGSNDTNRNIAGCKCKSHVADHFQRLDLQSGGNRQSKISIESNDANRSIGGCECKSHVACHFQRLDLQSGGNRQSKISIDSNDTNSIEGLLTDCAVNAEKYSDRSFNVATGL